MSQRKATADGRTGPEADKQPRPNTQLLALTRARGWTYEDLGRKLADEARKQGISGATFDYSTIQRFMNGKTTWPQGDTRRCLEALFGRPATELGFIPRFGGRAAALRVETPVVLHTETGTEKGDHTNRRAALATISAAALAPILTPGNAAAEAADFTRHATESDLGPGLLDRLGAAVHQIGATYPAHRPQELWPTTLDLRRTTHHLTRQRHTLREGRSIAHTAGMLSVILAWLAHDLGDNPTAEAYCADAFAQGHQADLPEVSAWADDALSTILLYADRPDAALAAATRGAATAPQDSPAHARLAAQVARAHARLGHADAFADATVTTRAYADRLPAHGAGLWGADAVRISSYDASSYLWLDQPDKARVAAEAAIAQYAAVDHTRQSPTRMAIAQLDLAAAHAALGEPDAAVEYARQALACPRLVESVQVRTRQLGARLRRDYPKTAYGNDVTAELTAQTARI